MGRRDKPPFRADHVGSLLRPAELLKAREDHADGRIDDDELRAVEDNAIRDVVRLQREVGLRTATDGEFRRASWHMDFIYSLDGVSKAPGNLAVQFHNEQGDIEFTPAAMLIAKPALSSGAPQRPMTSRASICVRRRCRASCSFQSASVWTRPCCMRTPL